MSEPRPVYITPAPPPLTEAQVKLLFDALRHVMTSPDGCGEVRITVRKGHVRFVIPAPSLDLAEPDRDADWLKGE